MRRGIKTVLPLLILAAGCGGQGDGGGSAANGDKQPVAEAPAGGAAGEKTPAATAAVPEPEACSIDGLVNCRRIGSDLVFGGQPSRDALRELAGEGFRTVVSTRGEGELDWNEKAEAESLGMRFVEIPMGYPIESIRDEWVDRFDELMKGDDRPLLAHCSSGNRVAGLWAVWLAEKRGVPPERALELGTEAGMTRLRPVVEKRLGITGG